MIKLPKFSTNTKKELVKKYGLTQQGVDFKLKRANDPEFIKDALEIEKLERQKKQEGFIALQKLAEDLIEDDEETIINSNPNYDRARLPLY